MQGVDQSLQVGFQILDRERGATNGGVNDTSLVGTVLHLTGLGILDGGSDVHGHGSNLRVRHQAARTEDLAKLTDDLHGIRGSDNDVEIQVTGLDLGCQIVETDDFGTSCLGSLCLVTLSEDGDTDRLAGTCRQHDGTTNHLIRFTCIDA